MATKTKLPKVTQYVKNVGKSLAFASIDAIKDNTSGIKEFTDINEDIFKEVYSSVRNYREVLKSADSSIRKSNAYTAIEAGIKNMIEDVKTGNFYNDRTGDIAETALGIDDFDFGDDEDYSFDDDDTSPVKSLSDSVNSAIGAAAAAQSTMVAEGTNMIVKSNKVSTKLIMAHLDKSTASVTSSIGSVYSGISNVNSFLNGPMLTHLENSKRYYEESLKSITEMNLMIKEMIEMQRNLYNTERTREPQKLSDSIGFDGTLDIRGYAKNVKRNIESVLGDMGLTSMGGMGGNPLMLYAAAPLKVMMEMFMPKLLTKDFKKSLKSFDKGVSSMFSQFIARLNTAKDDDFGGVLSFIGKIFGISLDKKTSINTSNYKKDAVPFDGLTRQSIIETIPGYLARIESALTGKSERHYDYEKGAWKSIDQIKKEFDDDVTQAIARANYDARSDLMKYLNGMEKSGKKGAARSKKLRSQGDEMFRKIFKDGGDFKLRNDDAWFYYGFESKADFDEVVKSLKKSSIRDLSINNMHEIENLSSLRRRQEANGGPQRHLFNGAYDENGVGDGRRSNPSKFTKGSGILATSIDEHGKNIFWYLNSIIDTIRNYRRPEKTGKASSGRKGQEKRSGGTDSGSGEKSGSDDSDGDGESDLDSGFQKEQAEREKEKNKSKGLGFGDWIEKKIGNTTVGKHIARTFGGAERILTKPMEYMTKLLNKADESMFKLMFGSKAIVDKDGNEIEGGVFQYIINQVKTTFDGLRKTLEKQFNSIKDRLKKVLKPIWDKYGKPVIDNVKMMAKAGWNRFKTGVSNTFGKGYSKLTELKRKATEKALNNGDIVSASDVEGDGILHSAAGRYVTKRGLTMISPGELILSPFNKREQKLMLALEKRDKKRIINAIGYNAEGNIDTDKVEKKLRDIYQDNLGKGAKNTAGGLLGAGAGLLAGFNPLLGAMAGAGLSILSNSKTFKKTLFGEEGSGGLVPKKVQDYFKKALPDMGDYGIAGGLLGLLTPFGPLGGAAIGAGIGLLKNSDGFKKFIFGDAELGEDGLISKESLNKAKNFLQSSLPKMGIGAVAGALLGPFGLIGNAALGAGAGLLANTDTFHKVLFGDGDSKGLFGAIKNGIFEPAREKVGEFLTAFKDYTKKYILDPLKDFWKPFQQSIKNTITGVGHKIADHINDSFEKIIGLPLHDYLQEKIFRPTTKFMSKVLKAPLLLGAGLVAAPFKTLGGIGKSMTMRQIQKGSATNMTASERLAFRDEHKFRSFGGNDKMRQQDEMLASMTEEELQQLTINSKAGLDSISALQRSKGKANEALNKEFSKFFNEKGADNKSRYSRVRYNAVSDTLKDIAEKGDLEYAEKAISKIKGLTDEEKKTLFNNIKDKLSDATTASAAYDAALKGGKDLDALLSNALGRKIKGRSDRRQIYANAKAELKARRNNKVSDEKELESASSPEEAAIIKLRQQYASRTQEMLTAVNTATSYLKKIAGIEEDKGTDKPVSGVKNAVDLVTSTNNEERSPETVLEPSEEKKSFWSKFQAASLKLLHKKEPSNDSKEATDARKQEEKEKYDERTANDANRKTAGLLKEIKDKLIGEKKKDKEEGGLLGKIGSGIGGVFQMLGGKMGTVAKWGLKAIGLGGGLSLLGYASEWVKKKFWPKLSEILFGAKDSDGNTVKNGILTGVGENFKSLFFGEDGEGKSGVLGWIGEHLINPVTQFVSDIKKLWHDNGGLSGIIGTILLPQLVGGWGLAMNNIVTPLVALTVKHLPSMLISLGKAIIKGIKIAVVNKGISRDKPEEIDSPALAEFKAMADANQSKLTAPLYAAVTKMFDTASSGMAYTADKAKATIDYASMFDANNASAEDTYDERGEHLNKSSNEIMYKKESGIKGLLGAKKSTNDLYWDEYGNIGLNQYDTWNTTDSISSRVYDASKQGFIRGLGGTHGAIGDLLSRASSKGFGRGKTKTISKIFGGGTKLTGKGLNGANNAGLKINNLMQESLYAPTATAATSSIDDFAKAVVSSKGLTGEAAEAEIKVLSEALKKGGTTAINDTAMEVLKNSGGQVDDVLEATLQSGKKALDAAEKAGKNGIDLSKFSNKVLGATDDIGDNAVEAVSKVAGNATDNVAAGGIKAVVKNTGSKLGEKISSIFVKLGSTKIGGLLMKACSKGTTKAMLDKALEGLSQKLAGKLAGKALNAATSAIAKFSPLTIAIWVKDFIWGYDNADTLLGVAKGDEYQIGFGQKCLCGIVNLINNQLTFGLIPTDVIIDIAIEFLFPLFGLDAASLKAARDRADDAMDAWNEAHSDDTYTNLEDFNNKDKWWFKAKKKGQEILNSAWDGIKEKGSKAWEATKEFVSDPISGIAKLGGKVIDKVKSKLTNMSDMTKILEDAYIDINAVKRGEYTIFNKKYWKLDDETEEGSFSVFEKIASVAIKAFNIPNAMMGWIGSKVKSGFKSMLIGISEGAIDSKNDVDAVKRGEYTVFSKKYWSSGTADNSNSLSTFANVVGTISKLLHAPAAMLGWIGTKLSSGFDSMINKATGGNIDATEDVNAVKRGEYTIFSKEYWKNSENRDTDNPLSLLGVFLGGVSRVLQAPNAMIGYIGTKVSNAFANMIEDIKDVQSDTDSVIQKVKDGKISVFSKEYWEIDQVEDNPIGLLGKISGTIQRLVNAPVLIFQNIFDPFQKAVEWVVGKMEWIKDKLAAVGIEFGEGRENSGSGRLYGEGHAYQSDRMFAGVKYGDSTIAKSGCAPVAATNLINNMAPGKMDVFTAAKYAEKNGMTVPGGGTDIRYFNSFFASQGIPSMISTNRRAIISALKNGNQVVLLGQDGSNAPGTPYGPNPHFIVAKGIDNNGNITVEDPDLAQESVVYSKDKLFKSLKSSVVTGSSLMKPMTARKQKGLGRRLLWGGDGEGEEAGPSVSALTSELGNLGTNIVKSIFGDAYNALYGNDESDDSTSVSYSGATNLNGSDNAEKIWNFLRSKGYTPAGTAGIMGNLYAESGLNPKNIQNSFESRYGSDDAYTSAVDSGSRGKESFSKDSAGYGLAQWTYHTLKRGLYEATVEKGKSVGDLGAQLEYLDNEFKARSGLYNLLTTTTSSKTAADKVLEQYERPAVYNYDARRGYAEKLYNQFSGSGRANTGAATNALKYNTKAGAISSARNQSNGPVVDYATFLQTIVTILVNISNNTELLGKILELLSSKLGITVDKAEIAAATSRGKDQAVNIINNLIRSNGSDASISKLINDRGTDFIVAATSAIAQE